MKAGYIPIYYPANADEETAVPTGAFALLAGETAAKQKNSSGVFTGGGDSVKNNFAGTVAPTVSNDSSQGYAIGSRWIDTVADESYICTDAAAGVALWSRTSVGTIAEVAGLQVALDAKAAASDLTAHTGNTANSHSVTKAQVGLGSADNTTDIAKPVSAATQTALDLKVDKVTGKQLSTEDFTSTLKTKLDSVAAGAEININSDWNAASGDAQILNKPIIPSAQVNSDWNSASGVSQILNKPTSMAPTAHTHAQADVTNLTTDLAAKEITANKNVANGYAGLDTNTRVPLAQLPVLSTTTTTSIAPILGANIGLPGYRRSKLIPISSVAGGSGDYQVELIIGESAGSAGADFHLGGNSQNFPSAQKNAGELKFVLPDNTNIPFFVAEVTGTTPNRVARCFVRMSGLTGGAGATRLVFLLYDNNLYAVPSQMSVIASVFNILADDFDAGTLDAGLWNPEGTLSLASSIATFDIGEGLASLNTFADNMELLVYKRISSTGSSYCARMGWTDSATAEPYLGFGNAANQIGYFWDWGASGSNGFKWTLNGSYTSVTNPSTTAYGLHRVARYGGAARGIQPGSAAANTAGSGVLTSNSYAVIEHDAGAAGQSFVDWVAVRQYLTTNPALGAIQDV